MVTAQQLAAALRAAANALDGGANEAQAPAQLQYAPPAQPPQQYAPPNAGLQQTTLPAPPPPPPANVDSDKILQLIQPHIGNEQIKAELGAAMRAMGINALPEAQPHQYGALFQAFQNVIARFTGGGQQQAPAASTSII